MLWLNELVGLPSGLAARLRGAASPERGAGAGVGGSSNISTSSEGTLLGEAAGGAIPGFFILDPGAASPDLRPGLLVGRAANGAAAGGSSGVAGLTGAGAAFFKPGAGRLPGTTFFAGAAAGLGGGAALGFHLTFTSALSQYSLILFFFMSSMPSR